MSSHKTDYKNNSKTEEEKRQKRSAVTVQLRKDKRQTLLSAHRNLCDSNEAMETFSTEETLTDAERKNLFANKISELVTWLENPANKPSVLQEVCLLLSEKKNPPIEEVLNSDIFPVIIEYLGAGNSTQLQFNALCALTNIAWGESSQLMRGMVSGAVPLLLQLVHSPAMNISEQAILALGNIIGDGPGLRDYVLQLDGVTFLLDLVKQETAVTMLQNISWVMVNLLRDEENPPRVEIALQLLPAFSVFLQHTDVKLLLYTACAITYFCSAGDTQRQLLIESGVLPLLVPLLGHAQGDVQSQAVGAIVKISAGSIEQIQVVLDCHVLSYFPSMLALGDSSVKGDVITCLGNILSGSWVQVQQVIDFGFLAHIVWVLGFGDFQLQKEAALAVLKYTESCTCEQIMELFAVNVAEALSCFLDCPDTNAVCNVLGCIDNIMKKAGAYAIKISKSFAEYDVMEKIENLQNRGNPEISARVSSLLDEYAAVRFSAI